MPGDISCKDKHKMPYENVLEIWYAFQKYTCECVFNYLACMQT